MIDDLPCSTSPMIIYSRTIAIRLLVFRCAFIIAMLLVVWAFVQAYRNLGYFLVVVLLYTAVFTLTGLTITANAVHITRFYFFGWLPFRRSFGRKALKTARLYQEFETEYFGYTTTLWDLILMFVPTRIKHQGLQFTYRKRNGIRGRFLLSLTEQEYQIIRKVI